MKEINANELRRLIINNKYIKIIDVRTPNEFLSGTVEGAISIPLVALPYNTDQFKKDDTIVIVCLSGARSSNAVMYMEQQGFANVYNLHGGMIGYRK